MPTFERGHTARCLLVFLWWGVTSCAMQQPVTPVTPVAKVSTIIHATQHEQTQHTAHRWWYARFLFVWPEGQTSAQFYKDTLIAHQVLQPILAEYLPKPAPNGVSLWRFHRRSGQNGGHQLSFIFYAHPKTAATIYQQLQDDSIVQLLITDKIIKPPTFDKLDQIEKTHIEDTSDRNWSAIIQKSWPYFIMGVSRMWLDMLDQTSTAQGPVASASTQDLLAHYKKVHASVTELWKTQGRHAFLHHLSALFGYESLIVLEQRVMRF